MRTPHRMKVTGPSHSARSSLFIRSVLLAKKQNPPYKKRPIQSERSNEVEMLMDISPGQGRTNRGASTTGQRAWNHQDDWAKPVSIVARASKIQRVRRLLSTARTRALRTCRTYHVVPRPFPNSSSKSPESASLALLLRRCSSIRSVSNDGRRFFMVPLTDDLVLHSTTSLGPVGSDGEPAILPG